MNALKFTIMMWLVLHVFAAGFLGLVYIAIPETDQARMLEDLPMSLVLIAGVELLVTGLMYFLEKIMNVSWDAGPVPPRACDKDGNFLK